jgi:ribonuclease Z
MQRILAQLAAFSCLVIGLIGESASYAESDFKVTLLGTGSPTPRADRFGPSTLVEAGPQKLLFDAGRGVPIRLRQLNVQLGKINVLFLTHYHSDHTSGIPDVWLSGWLPAPYGRRTTPFHVIGPVGAKVLMSNLERAYALDVKIRIEDQKLPPAGIATIVEEFDKDGIVYEKDGVEVIAFAVEHGPAIKPAVGYRVEYKGRSVTLSGDTRYDQHVIKYGTGSDVLIHEVGSGKPELLATSIPVQRIIAHHTTPREAGLVFSQTKPKMAVYTHLVLQSNERFPEPTLAEVIAETRQTYSGPLMVGEDLMSFEIGDTVTVRRYKQ